MILDRDIFTAVIATLKAGLASRSIDGVQVQQWYQPRQVGAPEGMALLLSTVTDHRFGFLGRQDKWDATQHHEAHVETQAREFHVQCTGQVKQRPPPAGLYPYSSGDLAKLAATILASDAGRQSLRTAGFGIERILDVRQPYGKNEADEFTGASTFDFVLAFNQVENSTSPIITAAELKVRRV